MSKIAQYFQLQKYGSDVKTEVLAGLTSFLSCAYIIFVNPSILQQAGIPASAVVTSTVLASALASIGMGLYANNPIVLAPGMGLNAFFTFTIVMGLKLDWHQALGLVFTSGLLLTLLSVLKVREQIIEAIPLSLRYATSAGIGLFICTIGLMNAGLIIDHPATLVTLGKLGPTQYTFLAGLVFTIILVVKKVKGALLYGIIGTSMLAWPLGRWYGATPLVSYQGALSSPDFSSVFALNWTAGLSLPLIPVLFSMMFTDLFDTLSTFVGVAEAGNLMDEQGKPRNVTRALVADSLATLISGPLGTSSTTSYIESAAGVSVGGRTGLTAVVAGLLFLPFLFLSPLISMIPMIATAPSLVLVGVFMMAPIGKINWDDPEEAIPAFLNLVIIPLAYSITQGIVWGFLSHLLIRLCRDKWSRIPFALWVIGGFALLALINH